MLIKFTGLLQHLKQPLSPLYVLVGSDPYFLNEAALCIKKAIKQQHDSEVQRFSIEQPSDWARLNDTAHHYDLFSETTLIDVECDKKSIDAAGKSMLQNYIKTVNPRCFIVLRLPNVPIKQLSWLSSNQHITVVQITSLNTSSMHAWIKQQLSDAELHYLTQIPALIEQYTHGNPSACAQLIQKLQLIHTPGSSLSENDIRTHLIDQSDYQLYELAEACLTGQLSQALLFIRKASSNRTEASLILWLLAQEIRLLIQLHHQQSLGKTVQQVANTLKIWPQRLPQYAHALKRLSPSKLHRLLHHSQHIDETIKTGQTHQVWLKIEQLVMQFASPI